MQDFKTPDLHAPRYRPNVLEIANTDFFTRFKKEFPEYSNIPNKELKDKIKLINGIIYNTAIIERDGVELPNGLGNIFIGSCKYKRPNIDYKTSKQYGKLIQHRNWDSDGYLAKIFYTNYEQKYRFKFHQLWGFTAGREFKRDLSKAYALDWCKYIVVDSIMKAALLFRRLSYKQKKQKEEQLALSNYNDLALE